MVFRAQPTRKQKFSQTNFNRILFSSPKLVLFPNKPFNKFIIFVIYHTLHKITHQKTKSHKLKINRTTLKNVIPHKRILHISVLMA